MKDKAVIKAENQYLMDELNIDKDQLKK